MEVILPTTRRVQTAWPAELLGFHHLLAVQRLANISEVFRATKQSLS